MMVSTTATFGSGYTVAGERTGGFLGRINRALDNFRAYRATLTELNALTDRQLADLGLLRSGLRTVAHRAVYGN
jgi:uncharacterized protein YjiS (DUF1127 family)